MPTNDELMKKYLQNRGPNASQSGNTYFGAGEKKAFVTQEALDNPVFQQQVNRRGATLYESNVGDERWSVVPRNISYWEAPQRVARYYHAMRSMPPGAQPPAWINPDQVTFAYRQLQARNRGKPWYEWGPLSADDDLRGVLEGMPIPPPEAMPKWEQDYYKRLFDAGKKGETATVDRDSIYRALYLSQKGVDAKTGQVLYDPQTKPEERDELVKNAWATLSQTIFTPEGMPQTFTGTPTFDEWYGAMTDEGWRAEYEAEMAQWKGENKPTFEGWFKAHTKDDWRRWYEQVTAPKPTDVNWAGVSPEEWEKMGFDVKTLNFLYQKVPWAAQAASGAAMGGSFAGIPGALVGSALMVGGSYVAQNAPDSTIAKIFKLLDAAYRGVERSIGRAEYEQQAGTSPEMFGGEADGQASWLSGSVAMETYGRTRYDEEGRPYVERLFFGKAAPERVYLPQSVEDQAEIREFAKELEAQGVKNSVQQAAQMLDMGGNYGLAYAMQELRQLIEDGADPELAMQLASQRYGMQGEMQDMAASFVLDPLDMLAPASAKMAGWSAGKLGNTMAAKAFGMADDVLEGTRNYGVLLRQLTPDELATYGSLSKLIAGADAQGNLTRLKPIDKYNPLRHLFGATPTARAAEFLNNGVDGISALLSDETDPAKMVQLVERLAAAGPADAVKATDASVPMDVGGESVPVKLPKYFDSAEAQSFPLAIREHLSKVRDLLDRYQIGQADARLFERIAEEIGTDLGKLLGDLKAGRRTGEAVVTQFKNALNAKAQAGDGEAASLLKSLRGQGALTGDYLKARAEDFLSADGTPYNADLFRAHLQLLLAHGMDEFAAKWFHVKPSGKVVRLANLIKRLQSALLLGLSPSYLLNNGINNIVTLAWDGLLGGARPKAAAAFWQELGINPARLSEGVGLMGEATGPAVGNEIAKATRGDDWIQTADDVLKNGAGGLLDKIQIFGRASAKVESWASQTAMFTAVREYWDRAWQPGVGFDKLPADLAQVLDEVEPGLARRIERAIARGKNRAQIEAEVFKHLDRKSLRDVLNPDELDELQKAGVYETLEEGLRNANTTAEVRKAFSDARSAHARKVAEEIRANARKLIEEATQKVQVEHVAGALDATDAASAQHSDAVAFVARKQEAALQLFGAIVSDQASFWLAHLRKMDETAMKAQELGRFERRAAWQKALAESDQAWRTFKNQQGARWLGIFDGLGADQMSETGVQVMRTLTAMHDNWDAFFELRTRLQEEFHARMDALPEPGKRTPEQQAQAANAWNNLNDQLMQSYVDEAIAEDGLQAEFDAAFAIQYAKQFGDAEGALRWRNALRANRRQMAAAQALYRGGSIPETMRRAWGENVLTPELTAAILKLNGGRPIHQMEWKARQDANTAFYRTIYQPLVAESVRVGAQNAPGTRVSVEGSEGTYPNKTAQPAPSGTATRGDEQPILEATVEPAEETPQGGADATPEVITRALELAEQGMSGAEALAQAKAERDGTAPMAERRASTPEERMRWAATHDQTTRLGNRTAFEGNAELGIESAWETAKAANPKAVVAGMDLRGVHLTNKEFGMAVGDAYIRTVGTILTDLGLDAYRMGGDEFAVIFADEETANRIMPVVMERLESAIIKVGEEEYGGARANYGIANEWRAAVDAAEAARKADPRADSQDRNTYRLTRAGEGVSRLGEEAGGGAQGAGRTDTRDEPGAEGQNRQGERPDGRAGAEAGRVAGEASTDHANVSQLNEPRGAGDPAAARMEAGEDFGADTTSEEPTVLEAGGSDDSRGTGGGVPRGERELGGDEGLAGPDGSGTGRSVQGLTPFEAFAQRAEVPEENEFGDRAEIVRQASADLGDIATSRTYHTPDHKVHWEGGTPWYADLYNNQYRGTPDGSRLNNVARRVLKSIIEGKPLFAVSDRVKGMAEDIRHAFLYSLAVNQHGGNPGLMYRLGLKNELMDWMYRHWDDEAFQNDMRGYFGSDEIASQAVDEYLAWYDEFTRKQAEVTGEMPLDDVAEPVASGEVPTAADVATPETAFLDEQNRVIEPEEATAATRLNAIRQVANEFGIATTTKDGKPMDNHLINALRKYGVKFERLEDVTPEQARGALEARKAAKDRAAAEARARAEREAVITRAKALRANVERMLEAGEITPSQETAHHFIREFWRGKKNAGDYQATAKAEAQIAILDRLVAYFARESGQSPEALWKQIVLTAGGDGTMTGEDALMQANRQPVKVYHGTSATFDKFDVERIGTNTGSGGFAGRGFYFTDSPNVAKHYGANVMEVLLNLANPAEFTGDLFKDAQTLGLLDLKPRGSQFTLGEILQKRDEIASQIGEPYSWQGTRPEFKHYTVEFDGREYTIHNVTEEGAANVRDALIGKVLDEKYGMPNPDNLGTIGNAFDAAQLSERLKANGYDGIITPAMDLFGLGTKEYVVFSPDQIQQVDGNTLGQAAIGKTPQSNRGMTTWLKSGEALIALFEKADVSTLPHEAVHALLPLAPAEDLAVIQKWLADVHGIKDLPEGWQHGTQQHGFVEIEGKRYGEKELLAKAFEQYLSEGKAPTSALVQVFEKMRHWMLEAYRAIGGVVNVKINNEMRQTFDRWMGDVEAKPAETAPGATPTAQRPPEVEEFLYRVGRFAENVEGDAAIRSASRTYVGNQYLALRQRLIEYFTGEAVTKTGAGVGALEKAYLAWREKNAFDDGALMQEDMGPRLTEFHHDAQGAIAKLIELQSGDAIGALHHPEIGDIDLVWGKAGTGKGDGYGLSKLLEFHPEVVDDLQNILEGMKVTRRSSNRIQLESERYAAGVRLSWNQQTKTWLLTAYEKTETAPTGRRTDVSSTEVDGTTPPSQGGNNIIDQTGEDFNDPLFQEGLPERPRAISVDDLPQAVRDAWETYRRYQMALKGKITVLADRESVAKWAKGASVKLTAVLKEHGLVRKEGKVYRADEWAAFESQQRAAVEAQMQAAEGSPDAEETLPPAMSAVGAPLGTVDGLQEMPIEQMVMEGWMSQIDPLLAQAEGRLTGDGAYRSTMGALEDQLTPDVKREIRAHLGKVYGQMKDVKMGALRYGESRRDLALLNYQRRTGFDHLAGVVMPYQFWYTRSSINWALRAMARPGIVADYLRLQQVGQGQEEREEFPTRLKGKIAIPLPFLPDWMNDTVYVDPMKVLYPFHQMLQPVRSYAEQKNQEVRKTETLLYDWIEDGEVDEAAALAAAQNHEGELWERARAEVMAEYLREESNPMGMNDGREVRNGLDLLFSIQGPSLPISWAYDWMTNRKSHIGQLPITRFIQNTTALLGLNGGRGVNVEAGIRKGLGLPEMDRFQDFRVDRELSNMAGDGTLSVDEALQAMIDRKGPAYEAAQRRVAQTSAVKYFASPLGADIFPEGEEEMRRLKEEYDRALDARYQGGDPEAINRFWDEHPEYEARKMLFKTPEDRLRNFLKVRIWDAYRALSGPEKRIAAETLGDTFESGFLNSETANVDNLPVETLAQWARALSVPNVPESAPGGGLPVETVAAQIPESVRAFGEEKEKRFPQIDELWELSDNLGEEARRRLRAENPAMTEYNQWRTRYLAEHPDAIEHVIGEDDELKGLPQDIQGAVYEYRAMQNELFPEIWETQKRYFAIADRAEKRAYLKQHPELAAYWSWRRQMAAENPQAAPYVLGETSLSKAILGNEQPLTRPPFLTDEEFQKLPPELLRELAISTYTGKGLGSGAKMALEQLRKQMAPAMDLESFIESFVRPALK